MQQPCYAVIDLETTGNQLNFDDIIQIGITFVRNNQIIDTYHSMIKTDLDIPPFIQALTSIEETMLNQAPYFHEVAADIHEKIKDCVFVAHNVDFDLKFIKKAFKDCHIHYHPKKIIDTLELFKIAFPTDKSYQLSELAESHGIALTNAHRADEDAATTAKLMIKVFKKFENLPIDTLKQLYYLSKHLKYHLTDFFFALVRNKKDTTLAPEFNQFEQIIYKKQVDFKAPKLTYEGNLKDLYEDIINKLGYTYRDAQLHLSETVFDQLLHSEKALIEAPLGSGKSLAYLLAALMYNIETGRHVMISTNTKVLQNQLIEKDIPQIKEAFHFNINVAIIKSRSDYISLGLISQILKDDTPNYEVNILKMQLLIWITETDIGDIHELNLRGGQKMYFEQKLETYVPVRNDIHYYNYLKRNAQNIQIGITNHAHLLHASPDNSIYTLFDDCIIDEAHRLPEYALNQVTNEISYSNIKYQLGLIGRTENEKLLKAIDELEQRRILEKLDIPPIDVFGLKTQINTLHDLNEQLFETIHQCIKQSDQYDDEIHKYHYVYEFDHTPILNDLQQFIHELNITLEIFNSMSHKTVKRLRKHLLYINDRLKQIQQSLKANHTSYLSIKNVNQKSTIHLHVKDYEVKDILTERLLDKFNALTFISGTLTFNYSFKNFKDWFNKDVPFNTFLVDSKIEPHMQSEIFVPNDVEPYQYQNIENYVASIVSYISAYVNVTKSKCLVLFTSYKMMHMVQDLMVELPDFDGYFILAQQQSQNQKIIQQFNHFEQSILLGTASFFEGFDFQAEGIKCVMIAKLPFMSRSNTKYWLMDNEFDSTFKDYVLPDAITRFRQGLGRLIRNEKDRGIVVSFDDRFIKNSYNKFFDQALENHTLTNGDIKTFTRIVENIQEDVNAQISKDSEDK